MQKWTRFILPANFESTSIKLQEISKRIEERKAQKASLESFIIQFEKTPESIAEFDNELWSSLVDYVTVYTEENILFTFKNGLEIQA